MQMGQGHKVDKNTNPVGVEEKFDVLSVIEELVDKHEESVSLHTILTLGEGREGSRYDKK